MPTASKEFRFEGVTPAGQSVQGTVMALSKRKAEKKVEQLSAEHGFTALDLQKRRTYRYRVRHPDGTEVTGEQKAFSADEVQEALHEMGLEVLSVRKK